MIDPKKLESSINAALAILDRHTALVKFSLDFAPDHLPFLHQAGKNEGAREVLDAFKLGISRGKFDYEPETVPAPGPLYSEEAAPVALYSEDLGEDTEDMDDEAPEEESPKFGVFYTDDDVQCDFRSVEARADYNSRSEAWEAARGCTLYADGRYFVQAL